MSDPLVSVIIPVFNAGKFIRATLESILNQSYNNLEIIVVDDGSSDDSASVVRSYGSKIRCISQLSSGNAAVPRNVGLGSSRGDLIAFFDADDLMQRDKIELQVAFFRRHPQLSVSLTDYINFSVTGEYDRSHFMTCRNLFAILQNQLPAEDCILEPKLARCILTRENFAITSSLLLRKEVIESCGGFDPKVAPSEDFDLVYRIAMAHEIGILNRVGLKRRLHEDNTSNNKSKVLTGLIRSREKLLRLETVPGLRRQLRVFLGKRYFDLSDHYIGANTALAISSVVRGVRCDFAMSWRAIRLLLKMMLSVVKPGRNSYARAG